MERASLTRFAWLSIAAALATIVLKTTAYYVTGSVGLLSDALESVVNLVAALMALAMLTVAARPPDEMHAFGYSKAEYFSSGLEGALILLAAASIVWTAVPRLLTPRPLEQVGIGLAVSIIAAIVNYAVARLLLDAAGKYRSITLEADADHLMTDVWTSAGVVIGIAIVFLTGWNRLDPIIAIIVAINILWTGAKLLRRSVLGLLDTALPAAEHRAIKEVFNRYSAMAFTITHCACAKREAGPLFRFTCWCRAIGLCNVDMICWNKWNAIFEPRCRERPCLLTWNRSVIRNHGKILRWIGFNQAVSFR